MNITFDDRPLTSSSPHTNTIDDISPVLPLVSNRRRALSGRVGRVMPTIPPPLPRKRATMKADMAPEEVYFRSLKPPCPGCGQTNTRFRYFNNRYRTPGTRISSYDQPCYRCLSPRSLVFILGGRKNEKKETRSPKTKSKTNHKTKNGENSIVRIPGSPSPPATLAHPLMTWKEDRSEGEAGTSAFAYNDDDDKAFRFFLHEVFPELHGGDFDILMHIEDDINHDYESNTTMTTTTTYHSNPSAPTPSIGVHSHSHVVVNVLYDQITMVQPHNADKEGPYLNQRDMHKDNEVHITTSLSSVSTITTTTAATIVEMSHEEQQIYEELLMMLNEQELPTLSNYIVEGS